MADNSNIVVMADGRTVDFGKRGKIKKNLEVIDTPDGKFVRAGFDVANGESFSIDIGTDHACFWDLLAYGISQKVTDSAAQADAPEDVAMAVQQTINNLNDGKFNLRQVSDSAFRGFADFFEAFYAVTSEISEAKGNPVPDRDLVRQKVLAMDEATVKSLKSNAHIAAKLAEITARKAAERAKKLAQSKLGNSPDLASIADLI